jgi:phage terminase large subunit-like protein
MAKNYAESIDKDNLIFQRYRGSIKLPLTKSIIRVKNSDAFTLDGANTSSFFLDEMHAQKNFDLYNVMKSGQGFQRQPLAIVITTAGFLLDGYPLYEMRKVCLDVLNGIKEDDTQFSALYQLDDDDDWMNDESCWIKANPSLGQTVTYQYLRDQVAMCKNNPSLVTGVLTKNFNKFIFNQTNQWNYLQSLVKMLLLN